MRRHAFSIVGLLVLSGCGSFLTVDPAEEADAGGVSADEPAVRSSPSIPADGGSDGGALSDAGGEAAAEAAAPFVYVPTPGAPVFSDDFARSDGVIGGGWTVKTGASFDLLGGAVRQLSFSSINDGVVLRPSSEALLDVEVRATYVMGDAADWASVLARVRPESDTPGRLTAYGLQMNAVSVSLAAYVSPSAGSQIFGGVTGFEGRRTLATSLVVGRSYRLYLRVRGTDPVEVEGGVFDASTGAPIASVRGTDEGPNRIVTPGRVGFGCEGSSASERWDDFERRGP